MTGETPYPRGTVPATMLAHLHDEPPRPSETVPGVPAGFDRVIARALAKDPADRYPSAGDLGRAAQAAAEGRPVTESERMVARGAAAPAPTRVMNGHEAPAPDPPAAPLWHGAPPAAAAAPLWRDAPAEPPPPGPAHTEVQPGLTLPLGERPRRRRGFAFTLLLATLAAAAVVGALLLAPGDDVDANRLPGAPVTDGEVEALAESFARAYGEEDAQALGRLLTRDVERVVPGARQTGRAAVLRAYGAQFADAATRGFELSDMTVSGGPTGRAGARYRATYRRDRDVTGTIVFGVVRDRGTPRIALISARQDA